MQKPRSFTQILNLAERLRFTKPPNAEQKEHPPSRDDLLRRIRQNDIASHLKEWLDSPGLRAPK